MCCFCFNLCSVFIVLNSFLLNIGKDIFFIFVLISVLFLIVLISFLLNIGNEMCYIYVLVSVFFSVGFFFAKNQKGNVYFFFYFRSVFYCFGFFSSHHWTAN